MIDAGRLLGEIIGLLGGLGSFLGVYGLALVLLTLLVLSFVNALSPASRKLNFFISVGFVLTMALIQAFKDGDVVAYTERLLPYFVVMAAPYLMVTLITMMFRGRLRTDSDNRLERIEALTAELNREVEAMKKWS